MNIADDYKEKTDTNEDSLPEEVMATASEVPPTWPSPPTGLKHNDHPDAQWFPDAGFGLFINTGIYSVYGVQPSLSMIKDYPAGYDPRCWPPEKYYEQAKLFNPERYDPENWISAAAKAGFQYAVFDVRHCDGYSLWPSKYGRLSTLQYMDGRDLVMPYVEACRKYGLKTGFYYSIADFYDPPTPVCFEYGKTPKCDDDQTGSRDDDPSTRANWEKFYDYIEGQIRELLTNYGTIDLFWFDACLFSTSNPRTDEILSMMRELQPGMVINDRLTVNFDTGDYHTPECRIPETIPSAWEWWETCDIWQIGHWGYNEDVPYRSDGSVLYTLADIRSKGGNFLLNIGPGPDGTMDAEYYRRCEEIAEWMSHSGASVIGARRSPGREYSNVPITRGDRVWYLHLQPRWESPANWPPSLAGFYSPVYLKTTALPEAVKFLGTSEDLPFTVEKDSIRIDVPPEIRTSMDDVIGVYFREDVSIPQE